MSVTAAPANIRREAGKLGAFLRRDLLVQMSYRTGLISDWVNLLAQVAIFAYVSKLVDPAKMPAFGGSRAATSPSCRSASRSAASCRWASAG